MKTTSRWLLLLGLALFTLGCRSSQPTVPVARAVPLRQLSGNIAAIDPETSTLTVKLLWKRQLLHIGGGCQIITGDNDHAALTDLKVGDPIDAWYVAEVQPPEARRIAVKGVTTADREAAREEERMQRILTPNPTERP